MTDENQVNDMLNTNNFHVIKFIIPITMVLSVLYVAQGYRNALYLLRGSNDLRLRYQEQQYILKRVNPNQVYEILRGYSGSKRIEVDPAIGLSDGGGGYPPWAYFTGLFLVPVISWPATKIYFACLNGASLGLVAYYAYRSVRPYGRWAGTGMASSVLAMGGNSFALGTAQYGLIVNALIVASVLCQRHNRLVSAGIIYGIALVKPSISAPFVLQFVIRRQWVLLGSAIAYVLIASGAIWILTGSDLITMLLQMLDPTRAGGVTSGTTAYGPVNLALFWGVPEPVAMVGTALTGLILCFVITWAFRKSPESIQLAIAATFGYYWTIHRAYDDVMLVFLLIALGELSLRDPCPASSAVFLLAAFLFWAPPSCSEIPYFGYFKISVWALSLAYLLTREIQWPPKSDGSRLAQHRIHSADSDSIQ